MRAKLVHGTNSMTWANRVLPTYMRTPRGSQPGESTRFLARKVQVGTKRNQPTSRANARSLARDRSFNRTVVTPHQDSGGGVTETIELTAGSARVVIAPAIGG